MGEPDSTAEKLAALRDRIWADQQVEIEQGKIARAQLGLLLPNDTTQVWPVPDMEKRDQICKLAIATTKPVGMVMCYDGYVSHAKPCPACEGKGGACEACEGKGYREGDRETRVDALVGVLLRPKPHEPHPTYRTYVRDLTGVEWGEVVTETGTPQASHYPQPE